MKYQVCIITGDSIKHIYISPYDSFHRRQLSKTRATMFTLEEAKEITTEMVYFNCSIQSEQECCLREHIKYMTEKPLRELIRR